MSDGLVRRALDGEWAIRSGDGEDGRTIELRLLTWGEVADTDDGREAFIKGAFRGTDPSRVTIESQRHDGELVGRGVKLDERDDGPYLVARVSDTTAGNDLLTLIKDGVIGAASVAFKRLQHRQRRDGVVERTKVELRRVAVLERGSYPSAAVVAVREEVNVDDPVVVAEVTPPPVDLSPIIGRIDQLDARVAGLAVLGGAPAGAMSYRAKTIGEALYLAATEEPLLKRAFVDQTTTDNPGLIPAAVLSEVRGIVNMGRRTINAFGARGLPPKGMTVSWPRLATPIDGLIGEQAAEKTAIVSAKVSFDDASTPIRTYAGGSDVSYQLIRRSDPSYLEHYGRVMLIAWSKLTNLTFLGAVVAGAEGSVDYTFATDTDGKGFIAALVDASLQCEAATGLPASLAIAATDLWKHLAGIFAPTSLNPTSAGGTAQPSSLTLNVAGFNIIHEPTLAAGRAIISNSEGASWLEDPVGSPNQITAEDVERLGQNVAYWSMGTTALFNPAAIVSVAPAGLPLATSRKSKDE